MTTATSSAERAALLQHLEMIVTPTAIREQTALAMNAPFFTDEEVDETIGPELIEQLAKYPDVQDLLRQQLAWFEKRAATLRLLLGQR
jgi:hypothetical protein